MARLPVLDRWIGTDRLAAWHRANGQYTVEMLVAHTVLIIWGYAGLDRTSLAHETSVVVRSYTDVLAATAALAVLVGVGVSSARVARRHLRYETWYFLHLYTYVAIALSFSHQLATGNDFITHPLNRAVWVVLYLATFGLLVLFRVAIPIRDVFRYRLRVESVEDERRRKRVGLRHRSSHRTHAAPRPASSSAGASSIGTVGGRRIPSRCPPRRTASSSGSPPRVSVTTARRCGISVPARG